MPYGTPQQTALDIEMGFVGKRRVYAMAWSVSEQRGLNTPTVTRTSSFNVLFIDDQAGNQVLLDVLGFRNRGEM